MTNIILLLIKKKKKKGAQRSQLWEKFWIHPKTIDWLYFGQSQRAFVLFDLESIFLANESEFMGFLRRLVKKHKTQHQEKSSFKWLKKKKVIDKIIELSNPNSQISYQVI